MPSADEPTPPSHTPDLNRPPGTPSHASPPPPTTSAQLETSNRFLTNSAIGICILCPLVALLPPRQVNLTTLGLGIAWCTSAGFVLEQRTGHGLVWHVGRRIPSGRNRERWEAEYQAALREEGREKEARERQERWEEKRGRTGWWKKVWMGREGEDWIERRAEREQEALDEGRGYGGLIVDQIREVFGIKGDDDEDEEDEEGSDEKTER